MAFTTPALTGELEINQATADSATRTIPITLGTRTNGLLVVPFTDINTSQAFQAHISYGVWDGAAQTTPTDRTATNTSTGATCSVDVAAPTVDAALFVCAVGGEHNTPAVAAESALQAYDGGAWF